MGIKGCVMGDVFHNHTYLEVDGKKLSEYSTFKEAIKAGLELKTISPHSSVRVREMEETDSSETAA